MILEATAEGDREQTRIPEGPRKSAAPVVIPRTQADVRVANRTLTLRRPIGQAPGRDRVGDGRCNVDDAAALFVYAGSEWSFVGVLRVDSIRDAGVDDECAESWSELSQGSTYRSP